MGGALSSATFNPAEADFSQSGVTGNELRTDTASFRVGYNAGPVQPYIGGRWSPWRRGSRPVSKVPRDGEHDGSE